MSLTTSSTELHTAIIIGSVRDGRFGPRVGAWVQKSLAELAIDADVIDLADLTFPPTMGEHPNVTSFTDRITRADAARGRSAAPGLRRAARGDNPRHGQLAQSLGTGQRLEYRLSRQRGHPGAHPNDAPIAVVGRRLTRGAAAPTLSRLKVFTLEAIQ